ncbi:hypothetical protein ACWDBD_28220 [Streptomyces sp. NPDC001118]
MTVSLDDGETVQADHGAHAVVGVGTVPRTEWLWHAGLDLTDGVLCGPDHPPHGRGRLRARLHRRGDPAERRTVAGYVRPGPDSAPILVGAVAPGSPLPPSSPLHALLDHHGRIGRLRSRHRGPAEPHEPTGVVRGPDDLVSAVRHGATRR